MNNYTTKEINDATEKIIDISNDPIVLKQMKEIIPIIAQSEVFKNFSNKCDVNEFKLVGMALHFGINLGIVIEQTRHKIKILDKVVCIDCQNGVHEQSSATVCDCECHKGSKLNA